MKQLRVVLSLAVILGLLAAIALPTYAEKGGNGKGKDKNPPASSQDKTKKEKGGQRSQGGQGPEDTSDPNETAEEMVTLCHKPGTPAEETLVLPESAVPAHLRHGDVLGACLELAPTPVPTDTAPITETATITLCHKPGTPAEKTLVLPASAEWGHLRHGDYLGECLEIAPTPIPTDTNPITGTVMISLCHKPGTPSEKTLILPPPAVPGHLRHGDELGPCPLPETPEASTAPPEVAAAPTVGRGRNQG